MGTHVATDCHVCAVFLQWDAVCMYDVSDGQCSATASSLMWFFSIRLACASAINCAISQHLSNRLCIPCLHVPIVIRPTQLPRAGIFAAVGATFGYYGWQQRQAIMANLLQRQKELEQREWLEWQHSLPADVNCPALRSVMRLACTVG